jgi:hypothetical protein
MFACGGVATYEGARGEGRTLVVYGVGTGAIGAI